MRNLERVLLATSRFISTHSTADLNLTINTNIRNGDLNHACKLFDQNPASRNVVSWNSIITGYIRGNQMQQAQEMFDEMPLRDVVSWNIMLSALHKTGKPEEVYRCFIQMSRAGARPNEFTFSTIITAFLKTTTYNLLIPQIHGLTIRLALNSGVFIASALMRGYADLGDYKGIRGVFDETLVKDVTTWNALALGYMDLGLTCKAQRAFDMMPEKNVISWTTLVKGYIKNKNLNKALMIFNNMRERNVISWTAMINGYVEYGKFGNALELFVLMLESGTRPNHFTYSSVLDACTGCTSLLVGNQVHSLITKSGIPCDVILSTSLVNMYAKCGDIEAAFCIFESMSKKNLISWNSIIGGYARHGLAKRALEEFDRMTKEGGLKPDRITFVNVLSACGHGGMVEEGERHFNSMEKKYRIKAGMEHYSCMVDLYGRAGELENAKKVIKEMMPFEGDVVVWGALIAACGLHSSVGIGEFAADGLCKLEKNHPAVYSMLSKIHGVTETKRMMVKESRIKKQKAASWVESHHDPIFKVRNVHVPSKNYSRVTR